MQARLTKEVGLCGRLQRYIDKKDLCIEALERELEEAQIIKLKLLTIENRQQITEGRATTNRQTITTTKRICSTSASQTQSTIRASRAFDVEIDFGHWSVRLDASLPALSHSLPILSFRLLYLSLPFATL